MQVGAESEVAVVGGGVMGLLTALNLSRAGRRVRLFEQQSVGREASWAGGGIVSPLYPWRYGAAVGALAAWSQGFYPQLGQELFTATGVDPQVCRTGLYWLDLQDEPQALAWAVGGGRSVQQVSAELLYSRLPMLGRGFQRGLWMPDLANVRNPRLLDALRKILLLEGRVELCEQGAVGSLQANPEGGMSFRAGGRKWSYECVVLAAGAWSGSLLAVLGLSLPVEPVKGQMILYKCAKDFLPAMVLAKGRYAIPRKDGHILVGSTLEHAGFDKTPTEEALASLKASAEELLPGLADAEVVGHWAGLRPGSPDGVPFIGEVPQYPGLWLNCGHYRNGLVLAPASCQLLVDLMLGRDPIVDPTPYSPAGRLS
ncbi:glycine oxidase ThiO [Pseudomonas benzenivorans]|uniref:Glycine oxidase ThiO n=1 Tax=Pseudomonas benzenivorans TaxID=556533 RepID=A0ABZ0PTB1_9PSED|nr:glycine oxidase ThiO [Pseudomonas benzenivorans]WPC04403.1 glycine oxidase ThiO [Pseudomonas benzenivorans]